MNNSSLLNKREHRHFLEIVNVLLILKALDSKYSFLEIFHLDAAKKLNL